MFILENTFAELPHSGYFFALKDAGKTPQTNDLYKFLIHFPHDVYAYVEDHSDDRFILITDWSALKEILEEYILAACGFGFDIYYFSDDLPASTTRFYLAFLSKPYMEDDALPEEIQLFDSGKIWLIPKAIMDAMQERDTHTPEWYRYLIEKHTHIVRAE